MSRVGIIGSGNFGSCIAKVIGRNIKNVPGFNPEIKMWVFDEQVKGESLVKIINTKHENVKYLPGHFLGTNVKACASVLETIEDVDYFVFVTPHQFLPNTLKQMVGHIKEGATGVLLTKGITFADNEIQLLTDTVEEILKIPCGCLMGANIANEIARGDFCESTLAFPDPVKAQIWRQLFQNENFSIDITDDIVTQQLSGTLKNVVAIGGGIIDGLKYGQSTKAAILRAGFVEIYKFAQWYFPGRGVRLETMIESCGFGDIVASSYGGRNRKCAEYFVVTGKTFAECESELLNGQKLQGTLAAEEMFKVLKARNATDMFPLFTTIYLITQKLISPEELIHYKNVKIPENL